MKDIKDLLKNFKIPIPPERIIEKIIKDYIKDNSKKITISLQNKTIFVKVDPYIKREILLKQKEVLISIKEQLPKLLINKIV